MPGPENRASMFRLDDLIGPCPLIGNGMVADYRFDFYACGTYWEFAITPNPFVVPEKISRLDFTALPEKLRSPTEKWIHGPQVVFKNPYDAPDRVYWVSEEEGTIIIAECARLFASWLAEQKKPLELDELARQRIETAQREVEALAHKKREALSLEAKEPVSLSDRRVRELADLLLELKRLDVHLEVPGASNSDQHPLDPEWPAHGYRLRPVLLEEELTGFERQHKIALPEDYRAFLKWIGNGVAGPSAGMSPLENAVPRSLDLSVAFPYSQVVCSVSQDGQVEDETEAEGRFAAHSGFLILAEHGCGGADILIVHGLARGQVWRADLADGYYMEPIKEDFYSWYKAWLAESSELLAR